MARNKEWVASLIIENGNGAMGKYMPDGAKGLPAGYSFLEISTAPVIA